MKRRIAVFTSSSIGCDLIMDYQPASDDYKQITEWVDVDFPDLEEPPEVAAIDAEIKRERDAYYKRLADLNRKRDAMSGRREVGCAS